MSSDEEPDEAFAERVRSEMDAAIKRIRDKFRATHSASAAPDRFVHPEDPDPEDAMHTADAAGGDER